MPSAGFSVLRRAVASAPAHRLQPGSLPYFRREEMNLIYDEKITYSGPVAQGDTPADIAGILRRLPAAFPDALARLMKWRRCTVEELAEYALASTKKIQRLRTDMMPTPGVDMLISLSVALRWPPAILQAMMQRAGRSFLPIEKDVVYQELQPEAYRLGLSMYQFNQTLSAHGFKPIGQFD